MVDADVTSGGERGVRNLWAPWRLSYVTTPKPSGCVFCAKADVDGVTVDDLVVARGETSYVVMNLYPYNNGHLMVVPYRHVAELDELSAAESSELQRLLDVAIRTLRESMGPEGFNVGLNLGAAAGAGIAAHLHWHVVPRWAGDTNFMPVLADVSVIPQHLEATRELLVAAWPDDATATLPSTDTTGAEPT